MIVKNDFHLPFCYIAPNLDEIYTVFSVSCNRFFSLTVAGYYLPNRVFCLHLFVSLLPVTILLSLLCHYFTLKFKVFPLSGDVA